MSLPSQALFFDENDIVIGTQFINCGWFCTAESIYRCITEIAGIPKATKLVRLYGINLPVEVLIKMRDTPSIKDGVIAILDEQLDNQSIKYKESRKTAIPVKGDLCKVNGSGDLAFIHEAKKFIGKPCRVIRICKSGLIQVELAYTSTHVEPISLPRKNIDLS